MVALMDSILHLLLEPRPGPLGGLRRVVAGGGGSVPCGALPDAGAAHPHPQVTGSLSSTAMLISNRPWWGAECPWGGQWELGRETLWLISCWVAGTDTGGFTVPILPQVGSGTSLDRTPT